MKRSYESLRQQALMIEAAYKKVIDLPNSKLGQKIRFELRDLIVDIRMQKNPRTIESRIMQIQQILKNSQSDEPIMRVDESVYLHNMCEKFRLALRSHPQYQ